jgi:hypothetical protein
VITYDWLKFTKKSYSLVNLRSEPGHIINSIIPEIDLKITCNSPGIKGKSPVQEACK